MPFLRGVEYPVRGGTRPPEGGRIRLCRRPGGGCPLPSGYPSRRGTAHPHRAVRARPGTGGRYRPGRADAHRRRSGDRQIHPAAPDLRARGAGDVDPVCLGGGISEADQAAGRPAGGAERQPFRPVRNRHGNRHRRHAGASARPAHPRFDSDDVSRGHFLLPRQRHPGTGMHRGGDAGCQGGRYPGFHRRACQQGRGDRRAQGDGAYRGLRPLFRGGSPYQLPDAPLCEKPLRRHE